MWVLRSRRSMDDIGEEARAGLGQRPLLGSDSSSSMTLALSQREPHPPRRPLPLQPFVLPSPPPLHPPPNPPSLQPSSIFPSPLTPPFPIAHTQPPPQTPSSPVLTLTRLQVRQKGGEENLPARGRPIWESILIVRRRGDRDTETSRHYREWVCGSSRVDCTYARMRREMWSEEGSVRARVGRE